MTTMNQRNITTTQTADLLRDRCEAAEYLLEQCADLLCDKDVHYVELTAFLRGDMPVADVLALKEQDA